MDEFEFDAAETFEGDGAEETVAPDLAAEFEAMLRR